MTKKITFAALMLAAAFLLPQLFHLTGIPQSGAVFLPMHIPVLVCGLILGPGWGMAVGICAPVLSALVTAMPSADRLPFMVIELAVYGAVSGLLAVRFHLGRRKSGYFISLAGAMLAGRLAYALSLYFAGSLLHLPYSAQGAIAASVTGLPGIIVQILLIPAILYALKRTGIAHELAESGKGHLEG